MPDDKTPHLDQKSADKKRPHLDGPGQPGQHGERGADQQEQKAQFAKDQHKPAPSKPGDDHKGK